MFISGQMLIFQRVDDGLPLQRHAVFEHVIGRAFSHHLHGGLFANCLGNQDKGDAQSTLPQEAQDARTVEPWQVVIGQDQVER
jgi:hypothetical protein